METEQPGLGGAPAEVMLLRFCRFVVDSSINNNDQQQDNNSHWPDTKLYFNKPQMWLFDINWWLNTKSGAEQACVLTPWADCF